jgi:hypothetical protein
MRLAEKLDCKGLKNMLEVQRSYLVTVSTMLNAEDKHGVFILSLHQTRKLCRIEFLYRALQLRC